MWRTIAVDYCILAIRVLAPLTVGMLVLTVVWIYAMAVVGGCWALAWLIDQTVSLLINACAS